MTLCVLTIRPRTESVLAHHRCSLEAGVTSGISLLAEMNPLFLIKGNYSLRLRKGLGISALVPAGESGIGEFPCTFPTDQGTDRRDEFARDSTHRHLVSRCRDFWRALGNEPRKGRDSAGCWRLRRRVPEPETAISGRKSWHWRRFSLPASWAVRIRSNFARLLCRYDARPTP